MCSVFHGNPRGLCFLGRARAIFVLLIPPILLLISPVSIAYLMPVSKTQSRRRGRFVMEPLNQIPLMSMLARLQPLHIAVQTPNVIIRNKPNIALSRKRPPYACCQPVGCVLVVRSS